jgi:hypothetical protein
MAHACLSKCEMDFMTDGANRKLVEHWTKQCSWMSHVIKDILFYSLQGVKTECPGQTTDPDMESSYMKKYLFHHNRSSQLECIMLFFMQQNLINRQLHRSLQHTRQLYLLIAATGLLKATCCAPQTGQCHCAVCDDYYLQQVLLTTRVYTNGSFQTRSRTSFSHVFGRKLLNSPSGQLFFVIHPNGQLVAVYTTEIIDLNPIPLPPTLFEI